MYLDSFVQVRISSIFCKIPWQISFSNWMPNASSLGWWKIQGSMENIFPSLAGLTILKLGPFGTRLRAPRLPVTGYCKEQNSSGMCTNLHLYTNTPLLPVRPSFFFFGDKTYFALSWQLGTSCFRVAFSCIFHFVHTLRKIIVIIDYEKESRYQKRSIYEKINKLKK